MNAATAMTPANTRKSAVPPRAAINPGVMPRKATAKQPSDNPAIAKSRCGSGPRPMVPCVTLRLLSAASCESIDTALRAGHDSVRERPPTGSSHCTTPTPAAARPLTSRFQCCSRSASGNARRTTMRPRDNMATCATIAPVRASRARSILSRMTGQRLCKGCGVCGVTRPAGDPSGRAGVLGRAHPRSDRAVSVLTHSASRFAGPPVLRHRDSAAAVRRG